MQHEQVCKQNWLTIPVVFSLGFFMMMATCSWTSRMNRSATPGCVCRTVQQMWMLGARRGVVKIMHLLHYWLIIYSTILFGWKWMLQFFLTIPGWVLQCVQIPALCRQCVRQTENIKNIWAYCHHRHLWISKHSHAFYLTQSVDNKQEMIGDKINYIWNQNSQALLSCHQVWCVLLCFDFACCANDLLGCIDVSTLSHVHHGGPAGGDDSSWPGACNRGGGVDSPLPVWSYKVLVVTVLFIAVEDHWGTFGGVTILERNVGTHEHTVHSTGLKYNATKA